MEKEQTLDDERFWKTKLAAWIHDPAEKALVLFHDPRGHEGGTVAELRKALFEGERLGSDLKRLIHKADRCAAAGDRPQFPKGVDERVDFVTRPVLIHPLTARPYDIVEGFGDLDQHQLKALSFEHFDELRVESEKGIDWYRTFLNFWWNGPHLPHREHRQLRTLWQLLPADTRVPDHTIWDHLSLTSALAGALCRGQKAALLSVSLGPVQGFIAQARTTSDLWAGSHLLSRLAWEAMR
ncbi:MAG: type III-B CRISPR-associated protein Cas10/Cmr2, partial [Candidatus Riflebacteria bacterium]|nr:type III-B CRISPR-associated protein Cas10/Cmr2 [Candidatus Riflebacteria bacterium]